MKKIFSKYYLYLALMLVSIVGARADYIIAGNGTATTNFPIYNWVHYGASQILFTPEELNALGMSSGTISSISLMTAYHTTAANEMYMDQFDISIKTTPLKTLLAFEPIAGFTQVYSAPLDLSTVTNNQWKEFQFNQEFYWDGNSSIILYFCTGNVNWGNSFNTILGTAMPNMHLNSTNGAWTPGNCPFPTFPNADPVRPNVRFNIDMKPAVVAATPASGQILQSGFVYGGADQPSVFIKRKSSQQEVSFNYVIKGPLPNKTIVYQAKENNFTNIPLTGQFNNTGQPFQHVITGATGSMAQINSLGNPTGALDINSVTNTIIPGDYEVTTQCLDLNTGAILKELTQTFKVAVQKDMSVRSIISPKDVTQKKYPALRFLPVHVEFENSGLDPLNSFKAMVRIYNSQNVLVYTADSIWQSNTPLLKGQSMVLEFENWKPMYVDDFRVVTSTEMIGVVDENQYNNTLPRINNANYIVKVIYEAEPEAYAITVPANGTSRYLGRPFRPTVFLKNNGYADMTDVQVKLTITHDNPNGTGRVNDIMYATAQDISGGTAYNFALLQYPYYIPPVSGLYNVTAEVIYPNDPNPDNNIKSSSFTVVAPLCGSYTIGNKFIGAQRNYKTINDAINDMYLKGVKCDVNFELTDAVYNEGDLLQASTPALDFRTRILGVKGTVMDNKSYTGTINKITFKPSEERSTGEASIRINMISQNGLGMMFGQASNFTRPQQALYDVEALADYLRKYYANNDGYITFDGGDQKSILLTVQTPGAHRTAVFFQSVTNVTVKNCIIKDGINQEKSILCDLPRNVYNAVFNRYYNELDIDNSINKYYSSGVVLRNVLATDKKMVDNYYHLDTINVKNIRLENNIISGFGYGIASMGFGSVVKISAVSLGLAKYYNNHNYYLNNTIYDVAKAGIFLGYEDSSNIEKNRIYNVTGACNTETAGIYIGEEAKGEKWGYNSTNLYIASNEISAVTSGIAVYGIRAELVRLTLVDPVKGQKHFPAPTESINLQIVNNSIWGLNPTSLSAARYGIRVYTQREQDTVTGPIYLRNIFKSAYGQYLQKDMTVYNNTIILDGDNGLLNTGEVVGIALQHVDKASIFNNAIAVLDAERAASCPVTAAILFEGYKPQEGGLTANRNAFQFASANSVPVYRFVELAKNYSYVNLKGLDNTSKSILFGAAYDADPNNFDVDMAVLNTVLGDATQQATTLTGKLLMMNPNQGVHEFGYQNQYMDLEQWQQYTASDVQSIAGDFTKDMVVIGSNPGALRIKTSPALPINSILNNRANKNTIVPTDILGNIRGVGQERFDIGAYEFSGRFYTNDIELLNISEPGSYRENIGNFQDAEYIMTKAPADIKVRLRNNGSLQLTNARIKVSIYREDPANVGQATFTGTPVTSYETTATLSSTDDALVSFNCGLNSANPWIPQAFYDLAWTNAQIPNAFLKMKANVTPRYRLAVSVVSPDEYLVNNNIEKYVRFYIKRAGLDLIVSAENTSFVINANDDPAGAPIPTIALTDNDKVAGRLNFDTVTAGLTRLKIYPIYDKEKPRFDYDVFDRVNWEKRSVDYTMYRTMIWSDGSDKSLDRYMVNNLEKFFAAYAGSGDKKNLIIGSQEFIRKNKDLYSDYVTNRLRVAYNWNRPGRTIFNNMPHTVTGEEAVITGLSLARNINNELLIEPWTNGTIQPELPNIVFHDYITTFNGFSRIGFFYAKPDSTTIEPKQFIGSNDKGMSVISATLNNNMAYLGADWRHFKNIDMILRSVMDFIDQNDSKMFPVELMSFDPIAVGNRVEISWTTASEQNSSNFEIERTFASQKAGSMFSKIGEMKASGNSATIKSYGPIVDRSVEPGASYTYRLKMVDVNGDYSYGEEKTVTLDAIVTSAQITPNPVSASAKLNFDLAKTANVTVTIYDEIGKSVKVINESSLSAGSHTLALDASEFVNGSYTVVISDGENNIVRSMVISK